MSISAVTLLSGYEFFQALKDTADVQSTDMAAMAEVVRNLNVIRDDLLHAFVRKESKEPIFIGNDPAAGGSTEATKVLEFYSLCPAGGDDNLSGLRQEQRVTYELVGAGDSVGFYRSVTAVAGPPSASAGVGRQQILDRVEQFRIAFHDGRSLSPSFSSDKALPIGLELTIVAYGQTWPLSIRLPCGSPEAQQ